MGLIVGLRIKFGWGKLINRESADGEYQLQLVSLYVFYLLTCSYMSQFIIDPLGIITLLRNWAWNLEHPHNTGSHSDQLSEIASGPSAGQWQITVEICTVCRLKPPVIDQTLRVWWNSEWCGLQRRWVNWVASMSQVSKLWRLNSVHFSLGLMILCLGHLDRAQLGTCAPLGFEWGHAVVSRSRCVLEGLEGHSQVGALVNGWRSGSAGNAHLRRFQGALTGAAGFLWCRPEDPEGPISWPSSSVVLSLLVAEATKNVHVKLSFPPSQCLSEHAVLLMSTPKPISGQDI